MATQAKEANPYNANKDWHNKKDKPFVSADGAFFLKNLNHKLKLQKNLSKVKRKRKINLITKKDMMI